MSLPTAVEIKEDEKENNKNYNQRILVDGGDLIYWFILFVICTFVKDFLITSFSKEEQTKIYDIEIWFKILLESCYAFYVVGWYTGLINDQKKLHVLAYCLLFLWILYMIAPVLIMYISNKKQWVNGLFFSHINF